MRRFTIFALAASVVFLPFAGRALAQEPKTMKGNIEARIPIDPAWTVTLKTQGRTLAVVQLTKEGKDHMTVKAKETTQTFGEGSTVSFKGDVHIEVFVGERKSMRFDVDEAVLAPVKE